MKRWDDGKTRKPRIFTGLFTWHYHAFINKTVFHFLNITVVIYTNFPSSNTVYYQIVTIVSMYTHIFPTSSSARKISRLQHWPVSSYRANLTCKVECFTNQCIPLTCPSGQRAQNETKGQRSSLKKQLKAIGKPSIPHIQSEPVTFLQLLVERVDNSYSVGDCSALSLKPVKSIE